MKVKNILQMMDSIEALVMKPENWWLRMRFVLEKYCKDKEPSEVKFYCENCRKHQKVTIEPMRSDSLNGNDIWGDIVCNKCYYIIASAMVDKPGTYRFVKVDE